MSSVDSLLLVVRRRERWADALRAGVQWGMPTALFLAAAGILAVRSFDAPLVLLGLTALPFPVILAWAWLRPRPLRVIARRVDQHYELDDRLGSAFEFRHRGVSPVDPHTTAIIALLEADAETRASSLDARPVVPLKVPRPRPWDALGFAALAVAAIVPPPAVDRLETQLSRPHWENAPATRAIPVDLALAEPLRRTLQELRGRDDIASQTADRILELLDQLERGALDREAVYAELERLEQQLASAEEQFEAELDEDPGLLQDAIEALAEALQHHEITEAAGDALAEGHADDVEAAFNEASDAAQATTAADDRLRQALTDAERALKQAAGRSSDTDAQLDEAERRLRKAQNEKRDETSEERERRLKKQERRVEELRRQQEREEAARRRLEELRRNAQDAANRRENSESRRRSLEKLARGAGGAARKAGGAQRLRQTRDGIEEAKTMVRKAGGSGESEDRRRQQFKRFSQAAAGKAKQGERGKSTLLVEGSVGEGEAMMMTEGPGSQEGASGEDSGLDGRDSGEPSDGGDEGDEGDEGDGDGGAAETMRPGPSDGYGQGSTDALGEANPRSVRTRDVHVDARKGRGASRAEVIRTSSQQGFVTESYRDVYTSYRSFAQSAMDHESLPAAQRRAVKRYYQLIAPRP